ncbi:MAG: transporter associated domain-containing protein [Gemmatimonadota bacterium]|nr:transporter associated domain-containing protein [Gemmatimonadota bacterium]
MTALTHRAIPVATGSIDQVVGILRIRDLLAPAIRGEALDIRGHLLTPLYVPESLPLHKLVERFREAQAALAVVLDDCGGVLGLVTRTDVLDDLAMGLPGTAQGHDDILVQRDDGSWLVDGACSLQDFEDRTRIPITVLHEASGVRTVAGLILSAFGRVPTVAEVAVIEGIVSR